MILEGSFIKELVMSTKEEYLSKFRKAREDKALWEGSFSYDPKKDRHDNTEAKRRVKRFVAYRTIVYLMVFIGLPLTIAASYLAGSAGVPGLEVFLPAAIAGSTALTAELYTGWMLDLFRKKVRQAVEDAKSAPTADAMMARLGVAYDLIRESPVKIRKLKLLERDEDDSVKGTDGRQVYDPNTFDWIQDRLAQAGETCLLTFKPNESKGLSGNAERDRVFDQIVESALEKTGALCGRWCGLSVELAHLYGLVAGYYVFLAICRVIGFFA
jgi:hypothetical protein